MTFKFIAAVIGVLAVGGVQASAPVANITSSSIPGLTFAQYTGTTVLGEGKVNKDVLYVVDERTGPLGKSWYIFFEPRGSDTVTATITFDETVRSVFTTKDALDASNSLYGAAGISYGTSNLIGLESGAKGDVVSFSGNTLSISLTSQDPGDHLRVFTSAVPEPETGFLTLSGLVGLGFAVRRRQR